jgi:hypothetical protein
MINLDAIAKVRNATVAVGLAEKNRDRPVIVDEIISAIAGSAFFIDCDGYIMTAAHVLKESFVSKNHPRFNDSRVGVFSITTTESRLNYNFFEIETAIEIKPALPVEGYSGPADLDIGIAKLRDGVNNSLEATEPSSKLTINDELAMCGYPGKWQSMHVDDRYFGTRLQPVTQFGRIAGLMPLNECSKPYGIITDIIGTGGSSGSPIVSAGDGHVVAIEQRSIYGNTQLIEYQECRGLS